MKLECKDCGAIDHVLVDGYFFGDRLLEGVNFMVKDQDGIPTALGVVPEAQSYFDDLNQDKWLRTCEKFCEQLDIAQCPKCGGDVVIWGNSLVWHNILRRQSPKVIPMTRSSDLLANLGIRNLGRGK